MVTYFYLLRQQGEYFQVLQTPPGISVATNEHRNCPGLPKWAPAAPCAFIMSDLPKCLSSVIRTSGAVGIDEKRDSLCFSNKPTNSLSNGPCDLDHEVIYYCFR